MNPRIDLQGTSVIRDYTVRVYVYGTLMRRRRFSQANRRWRRKKSFL
jgi:hypothetical protein